MVSVRARGGGAPLLPWRGPGAASLGRSHLLLPNRGQAPARCQPYFPSCADDAAYSVHVAQRSDGESRKEQTILLASGRIWSTTSPLPLRRKTDVQRRQGRETEMQGRCAHWALPQPLPSPHRRHIRIRGRTVPWVYVFPFIPNPGGARDEMRLVWDAHANVPLTCRSCWATAAMPASSEPS